MDLIKGAKSWWLAALAVGFVVRVALMSTALPWTHEYWFGPFLLTFVQSPSLDPWTQFLGVGGEPVAFPYGPVYIVVLAPFVWLGDLVGGTAGALIGLRMAILVCDVGLLLVIRRLASDETRDLASVLYWLSPITLYTNYWHGQMDVVPTLALMGGLLLLRERRFLGAGALLAASVAAKFSMGLAAPFIAVYLIGSGRFHTVRGRFGGAFVVVVVVTAVVVLLSPGFHTMVLNTPEIERLYALAVSVQPGIQLYALPVALLAFFYVLWRIRRLSFEMLLSAVGAAFFALVLLTQPAPGWIMWALPFLTLHIARFPRSAFLLGALFSALFVLFHLSTATGAIVIPDIDLIGPLDFGALLAGGRSQSITYSLYFLVGFALLLQMIWRGIVRDPYRQSTRKPLVTGIAGDSGVGKDTLVNAIVDLFDEAAVSRISGDDYHIWDRNKPAWRSLTHLNPRSNDLQRFDADVMALAAGESVRFRHYDHSVGAKTEPVITPPREVVIASGLHALHNPSVRRAYDLSIYLHMDESLRRHFKIQRDVTERGHSLEKVIESIDRRLADASRYIHPQREHADLVMSLVPPGTPERGVGTLDARNLRLKAVFRRGVDTDTLVRQLVSLCGVEVSERTLSDGETELLICGNPGARDVAATGRAVAPRFLEHLALTPTWRQGMTGIMQLIVLRELSRVARKRVLAG